MSKESKKKEERTEEQSRGRSYKRMRNEDKWQKKRSNELKEVVRRIKNEDMSRRRRRKI
jgi:hypothetical protein